jgi:hypothetical protein
MIRCAAVPAKGGARRAGLRLQWRGRGVHGVGRRGGFARTAWVPSSCLGAVTPFCAQLPAQGGPKCEPLYFLQRHWHLPSRSFPVFCGNKQQPHSPTPSSRDAQSGYSPERLCLASAAGENAARPAQRARCMAPGPETARMGVASCACCSGLSLCWQAGTAGPGQLIFLGRGDLMEIAACTAAHHPCWQRILTGGAGTLDLPGDQHALPQLVACFSHAGAGCAVRYRGDACLAWLGVRAEPSIASPTPTPHPKHIIIWVCMHLNST